MPKLSFNPEYENCACNYCQSFDFRTLSKKDRYGLNATTVICRKCGLIFLNPRMTGESYQKFYQESYRRLILEYKNSKEKKWGLEKNFAAASRLGSKLARYMAGSINSGTMIEVGSSTGGMLAGFKSEIPELKVVGIEPSKEESDFANLKGIKTITRLAENLDPDLLEADNVLIARSINHLFDPGKFFAWARKSLRVKGKLIIVALDFLNFCQKRGRLITQIDHPFMFSRDSLKNYAEVYGFEIVLEEADSGSDYINLICEKTDKFRDKKINNGVFHASIRKLNPVRLRLNYLMVKI